MLFWYSGHLRNFKKLASFNKTFENRILLTRTIINIILDENVFSYIKSLYTVKTKMMRQHIVCATVTCIHA